MIANAVSGLMLRASASEPEFLMPRMIAPEGERVGTGVLDAQNDRADVGAAEGHGVVDVPPLEAGRLDRLESVLRAGLRARAVVGDGGDLGGFHAGEVLAGGRADLGLVNDGEVGEQVVLRGLLPLRRTVEGAADHRCAGALASRPGCGAEEEPGLLDDGVHLVLLNQLLDAGERPLRAGLVVGLDDVEGNRAGAFAAAGLVGLEPGVHAIDGGR
jgi:hypothetical protein